ncbi:MAG TPA: sigma-70 family RNA polymerase sigma factor [Armatimonadota bacterium]|jgi:RNA polymerase sigma-70 factor (ECF subfamily)
MILQSDAELVTRVLEGEVAAYGLLMERHQAGVYRLSFAVAGNGRDAEELAHDALVEGFLKLRQLRQPERFGSWVRQVALNHARAWRRGRRLNLSELPEDLATARPGEPPESHHRLCASMACLRADQRSILVLHYWEGLSYLEMSRYLGVPMGTVMSRLYRARKELRLRMEDEEMTEAQEVPQQSIRQEVEAEISLLLAMQHGDREARERLSIILRRSPERLVRLLREPSEGSLEDLSLLLGRLGPEAMGVVLAAALSPEPALRAGAGTLLRLALSQPVPAAPKTSLRARDAAYLLIESLMESGHDASEKVALLTDLMLVTPDEDTVVLLSSALPCWPEAAYAELLDRFWASGTAEELWRQADLLHALCRWGTRFAADLLPALKEAEGDRLELALTGVEGLSRALGGDWRCQGLATDEETLRDGRFRRHWPTPPPRYRDPDVLAELAEHLRPLLSLDSDPLREAAVRSLSQLRHQGSAAWFLPLLEHPATSTRVAAIRALSELGAEQAVPALMGALASQDPGERTAAVEALGRLKATAAEGALLGLVDDVAQSVRRAVALSLGALGTEAATAALRGMLSAKDKTVSRAAASALYGGTPCQRKPDPSASIVLPTAEGRVRDGARPYTYLCLEAALRELPEAEQHEERALTHLISRACIDYSGTRRALVDCGLMRRESGVYRFTSFGRVAWRVERFLRCRSYAEQ